MILRTSAASKIKVFAGLGYLKEKSAQRAWSN